MPIAITRGPAGLRGRAIRAAAAVGVIIIHQACLL